MHSSVLRRTRRGGIGTWLLCAVALIGGWVDIAERLAPRPEVADTK